MTELCSKQQDARPNSFLDVRHSRGGFQSLDRDHAPAEHNAEDATISGRGGTDELGFSNLPVSYISIVHLREELVIEWH
jgi:hypothetical protein